MKKFVVLRVYKTPGFSPDVILETDSKKDAQDYTRVMRNAKPEYSYYVFSRLN